MIFRTASCQKAARCCYALRRTEMPLRAVRGGYGETILLILQSRTANIESSLQSLHCKELFYKISAHTGKFIVGYDDNGKT